MVHGKTMFGRNHTPSALAWGICALFFVLCIPACSEKPKQAPPPPPTVTIVQPVQRVVTDYLELTGNTQAFKTVQLRARIAGYLEKVLFQDGQLVKEGQPLFLIQQDTYVANLKQAEADILTQKARLRRAQVELERYSRLLSQKAAAELDVDNWLYERDSAQAALLSSEARRDLAKLDLSYTQVTAPFDGRIDRRQRDPGNLVGSGETTVLAEINQINPIYIYFNISDSDLARLTGEAHWTPGRARSQAWPLHMGLTDEKGYPHKGSLDFASISFTSTSGTLLVRGVFSNPDGKILPGLYARVRMPLKAKTAFLIPQEAPGHDQRGTYVLIVNRENMVDRVGIRTGALADNLRVVEEGLSGKEWVVVKGVQKAIPGKKVAPEKQVSGKTAVP
jgi:RND family efflux transporter MFP subunit